MKLFSLPGRTSSKKCQILRSRIRSKSRRLRRLVHESLETRFARAGLALFLDGVDDYANAGDSPVLDLGIGANEDFTIETSFYVANQTAGNKTLIYKENAYALFYNENGTFFRVWTGPASNNFFTLQSNVSPGLGWHHIAGVFDNELTAATDLFALHLDGVQIASTSSIEVTPGINNSSSNINIGSVAGVNPFSGWIEETRLSNTVRYNGPYTIPSTPFAPDAQTRALWHFDEDTNSPTGPLFVDASGNSLTLTGVNGAQTANPGSDVVPPPLSTLAPADNSIGVALNANLVMTFGENIQKGSGNILIKRTSDNSLVQSIAVTDAAVATAGSTVTINPNDFLDNTSYYVEVAAGAFKDLAANNFVGISGPNTWNFTTAIVGSSVLSVIGQTFYGGAGDQEGTSIAVVGSDANPQVYTSGFSNALNDEGIVNSFGSPTTTGTIPLIWDKSYPGAAGLDRLLGIDATTTDVFVAGTSYSRTTDNVGDKEQKGITVDIPAAGGTMRWDRQSPGAPGAFTYGGYETANDTTVAIENGQTYIYTTGQSQSGFSNGGRLFLVKLDAQGNILWSRTDSNTAQNSSGRRLLVLNNSIYVVGGNSDSGTEKAYIKKYLPDGTLAWAKTSAVGAFNSIASDGSSLLAVGTSFNSNSNFLAERWDLAGNVLWSKTYDRNSATDVLYGAAMLNNRLYAVGSTTGGTAGGSDGVLLELDTNNGTLLQSKTWGGAADDSFADIGVSSNRLHVVGKTRSYGGGGADLVYVVYGIAQVQLSGSEVTENATAGGTVGNLTLNDAPGASSFVLVAGAGSTDNTSFSVDTNGGLKTANVFNFETKPMYSIRVRATDASGQSLERPFSISVLDLPELAGMPVIGDGTSQRSLVNKVTLLIDDQVTIDAGAFTLIQRGSNAVVSTQVTQSTTLAGQTQVVLTFSGSMTRGNGALVDGYYELTVDGSKIRNGELQADFNGDGTGGDGLVIGAAETDNFFALYGDTNGDGLVGIAEFGEFRASFGKTDQEAGYNALLDYDRDGAIGVSDFGQFRSRFGKAKLKF